MTDDANPPWAARGSQLQVQLYVNRKPREFAQASLDAMPELSARTTELRWVAPLEENDFAEPRDGAFLRAIGCEDLSESLREFWPARGPVWDALAVFDPPDAERGVVLVEAKANPREVYAGGSKAGTASREQIVRALQKTRDALGIEGSVERWLDPLRPDESGHSSVYQSANRYAHLGWLRNQGIDAWLANVFFVDDETHIPTSRAEWQRSLVAVKADLGIPNVPFSADVFVPAFSGTGGDGSHG